MIGWRPGSHIGDTATLVGTAFPGASDEDRWLEVLPTQGWYWSDRRVGTDLVGGQTTISSGRGIEKRGRSLQPDNHTMDIYWGKL